MIWHDYMAAVTEGQPCVEFPQPTESLAYRPFFGKYETMDQSGVPGTGLEPNLGLGSGSNAAPTTHAKSHHGKETATPGVTPETPAAGTEPRAGGGAPTEKTPAEPAAPGKVQAEPGAGTPGAGAPSPGTPNAGGGSGGATSGGTAPP